MNFRAGLIEFLKINPIISYYDFMKEAIKIYEKNNYSKLKIIVIFIIIGEESQIFLQNILYLLINIQIITKFF